MIFSSVLSAYFTRIPKRFQHDSAPSFRLLMLTSTTLAIIQAINKAKIIQITVSRIFFMIFSSFSFYFLHSAFMRTCDRLTFWSSCIREGGSFRLIASNTIRLILHNFSGDSIVILPTFHPVWLASGV